MFCPNCGEQNADAAVVCAKCGAPLVKVEPTPAETPVYTQPVYSEPAGTAYAPQAQPAEPAPEKKQLPVKTIAICAAAVVAVILIIAIASSVLGGGDYALQKDTVYVTIFDEELVAISSKGINGKVEVDGDYASTVYSADDTAAAVYISGDETLYYYKNGKFTLISDEVENYYAISADGSTVIYFTEGDEAYDLYIFSGGKSKLIASDVDTDYYCVSPSGSAVGYVEYDYDDGVYTGHYYNGKVRDLGKNKAPFAISDSGKYVYYIRTTDDYNAYVQKGEDGDSKVKLGEFSSAYFNSDLSEVLLYDGSSVYYSSKAGERTKAFTGSASMIVPAGTQRMSGSYSRTYIYGVKSVLDKLYYSGSNDRVVRLKKNLESETVVRGADSYYLANDGKTLIYLKGDSLRTINSAKSGAEGKEIADEVRRFAITDDGKIVFYINEDDELYSQKGSGKPQLVCDDPNSINASNIYNGDTLMYVYDDELYYTKGGKGKKVSGIDGDVEDVAASRFLALAYVEDGKNTSIYFSKNGKTFEMVYEY